MSIFNAIELSALPAPAVIETLDFDAIMTAMKADLLSRDPNLETALSLTSEPLVKLLETCAFRELILRQRINDAAKAVMLPYATHSDLDNLAALYGVARLDDEDDERLRARVQLSLEGQSTAGPVGSYIFWASSASSYVKDVEVEHIAPGEVLVTVLSTLDNGDPRTLFLLPATNASTNKQTIAADGTFFTIESGDAQPAVLRFDPRDSKAKNPHSSDVQLRDIDHTVYFVDKKRYEHVIVRGERRWAINNEVQLADFAPPFQVDLDHPYTIYIVNPGEGQQRYERVVIGDSNTWYVDGVAQSGRTPPLVSLPNTKPVAFSLLQQVAGTLDQDAVRPLTDKVIVKGAEVIEYTLTATLTMSITSSEGEVARDAAEKAIQQYVKTHHRLGHDIIISGIHAALHQVGVHSVQVVLQERQFHQNGTLQTDADGNPVYGNIYARHKGGVADPKRGQIIWNDDGTPQYASNNQNIIVAPHQAAYATSVTVQLGGRDE